MSTIIYISRYEHRNQHKNKDSIVFGGKIWNKDSIVFVGKIWNKDTMSIIFGGKIWNWSICTTYVK